MFTRHHFYCTRAHYGSFWLVCERSKHFLSLRYPTRYRADIVRGTLQRVFKFFPDRLPIARSLMWRNLDDWESTRYWCGELIKKEFNYQFSENV